jgi:hypothetical protein
MDLTRFCKTADVLSSRLASLVVPWNSSLAGRAETVSCGLVPRFDSDFSPNCPFSYERKPGTVPRKTTINRRTGFLQAPIVTLFCARRGKAKPPRT